MRRRKACDACHSRKIKCDLALPKCDWCFHRKIPCTSMERVRGGDGPVALATDSSRNQHVEYSTPTTSTGSTPNSGTPNPEILYRHRSQVLPGVRFGKLHFAGHDLGSVSSYNGIPSCTEQGRRWIRSCTGQDAVFPDLPGDLILTAQNAGDMVLPSLDVVEEYLLFFRSSHLKLEFPVVDSVIFRDTIRVAYEQVSGVSPSEVTVAKASVFAFLSVISLFEGERRPVAVDGDACALKARHLLSTVPQELGLTALQTALMLAIHQLFSGQIPLCAIYHSIACRIMFMLGGHIIADPWTRPGEADESESGWMAHEKRHLRKLFWLCYTLDKEISLRTGQPPAVSDDHCDLTLPSGYLEIQYLDEYLYADVARLDESAVALLPGDLRLTMIKSKACKLLYSAEALRKSDADLLRDIRELDAELERWRLSVPQKHRPVLSLPQSSMWSQREGPKSVRTILINFEYHYLMATIHQATGRCRAWNARESHEMASVRSSLALAVEASRSTVLYLRTAVNGLLEAASWTIVFYPMSAVVTIFCNILWDPLHPRAQDDLALLEAAPELIRGIRRRRMTENEMVHLRVADDFLAELVRLGKHAITKARQDLEAHNHLRYWAV